MSHPAPAAPATYRQPWWAVIGACSVVAASVALPIDATPSTFATAVSGMRAQPVPAFACGVATGTAVADKIATADGVLAVADAGAVALLGADADADADAVGAWEMLGSGLTAWF